MQSRPANSARAFRGMTALYGADSITVESNCRDSQTDPLLITRQAHHLTKSCGRPDFFVFDFRCSKKATFGKDDSCLTMHRDF